MVSLVCARDLPILRPVAEELLAEVPDTEDIILQWPETPPIRSRRHEVVEKELALEEVQEFSDGSRRDGAAAAANRREATYFGKYATVMDAELLGICLCWEKGQKTVALDSQGAIARAIQLFP